MEKFKVNSLRESLKNAFEGTDMVSEALFNSDKLAAISNDYDSWMDCDGNNRRNGLKFFRIYALLRYWFCDYSMATLKEKRYGEKSEISINCMRFVIRASYWFQF